MRLEGRIDDALAQEFIERYQKIQKGTVVEIVIKSHGGLLACAHRIAQVIIGRYSEIEPIMVADGYVSSAAVHIFVAGVYRYAYEGALFHLHMPVDTVGDGLPIDLVLHQEVSYMSVMTKQPSSFFYQAMIQGTDLNVCSAQNVNIVNFGIIPKP